MLSAFSFLRMSGVVVVKREGFPPFPLFISWDGGSLPPSLVFLILTKKNALTRKETDGKGGML